MAILTDDARDLLFALRECLCLALSATPAGEPCRCCVVHGTAATWWEVAEGLGWVRLVRADPLKSEAQQRRCPTGGMSFRVRAVVELGIVRCAPQPVDPERMLAPTCEAIEVSTDDVLADMQALYSLPECCALPKGTTVGSYTPMGPMGGGVGGNLQITVPGWLCLDCPSPAESPAESPGESP